MRLNVYLAKSTSLSRRHADDAIAAGKVLVNSRLAVLGEKVEESDNVTLDGQVIKFHNPDTQLLMLHKPTGYVCSHDGQGSRTIYELLPLEFQQFQPVGRLDKESSGLLLMTNDGQLLQKLAHPSSNKEKVYEVRLNKPLTPQDQTHITTPGVDIGDPRPSQFDVRPLSGTIYRCSLQEGRNRQVRRTFSALGYKVTALHRISFGPYQLDGILNGQFTVQHLPE